MKWRQRPILLASGLGILSLLCAWGFLQFKIRRLNAFAEPVTVLVAAKDIPEGTPLEEAALEERIVPRQFVQPAAIVSLEGFSEAVTVAPILQGEQILETKLTHLLKKTGLSVRLQEGMRAISLSLDEPALRSGLIRPHNFVDVLATLEGTTQTLIQRSEVLAVDEDSVTLALDPKQAERLSFALDQGRIKLILRPQWEEDLTEGFHD